MQESKATTPKLAPLGWVYLMFFFSGFPALIYQIIWQRALFSIYGVNIQSVTVVVSAFMLGLGVGSLLADSFRIDLRRHCWQSSASLRSALPFSESFPSGCSTASGN